EIRKSLRMAFGIAAFDDEILAFDVAERTEPLEQRVVEGLMAMGEETHAPDLRLGAGAERQGGEAARCQHDELAALHSITRSARARNAGDRFSPIAFAVLRLTASSKVVGCSTGMSAGFTPRKTLSTRSAARRYLSGSRSP